jgi:hypothetical protein
VSLSSHGAALVTGGRRRYGSTSNFEGGMAMPRIRIEAVSSESGARRWTLSERIVADKLDNDHNVGQLIERLSWARPARGGHGGTESPRVKRTAAIADKVD